MFWIFFIYRWILITHSSHPEEQDLQCLSSDSRAPNRQTDWWFLSTFAGLVERFWTPHPICSWCRCGTCDNVNRRTEGSWTSVLTKMELAGDQRNHHQMQDHVETYQGSHLMAHFLSALEWAKIGNRILHIICSRCRTRRLLRDWLWPSLKTPCNMNRKYTTPCSEHVASGEGKTVLIMSLFLTSPYLDYCHHPPEEAVVQACSLSERLHVCRKHVQRMDALSTTSNNG